MNKSLLLSMGVMIFIGGCGSNETDGFRDSAWKSTPSEIINTEEEKGNEDFTLDHLNDEYFEYEEGGTNDFVEGKYELLYENVPVAGTEMNISYSLHKPENQTSEQKPILTEGVYFFSPQHETFDRQAILDQLDEQFGERVDGELEGAIHWESENTEVAYYEEEDASSLDFSFISFTPKEDIIGTNTNENDDEEL